STATSPAGSPAPDASPIARVTPTDAEQPLRRAWFELLEPVAQPEAVGSAAGEELAPEAHVPAAPAHEVGHERIAGDKPAARQRERERTQVERVAGTAATLGEVALQDRAEPPPAR